MAAKNEINHILVLLNTGKLLSTTLRNEAKIQGNVIKKNWSAKGTC
jgi:hypothetical protein